MYQVDSIQQKISSYVIHVMIDTTLEYTLSGGISMRCPSATHLNIMLDIIDEMYFDFVYLLGGIPFLS